MSERRPRPRRAIRRATWLRVAAVLIGAAACVEITSGEGGVQSVALGFVPPSIVAGDQLRDTLGQPLALRGRAYNAAGDTVSGATFTYGFLPIGTDTGRARTALVVDSATGAVRADSLPGVARARVTARFGGRLQVVDSLSIVRPPRRLTLVSAADTLVTVRYLCIDSSTGIRADTLPFGNASRALTVRLLGDSTRDSTVAVPDYLVRYRVTGPAAARRGPSPYRDERPAVYVTHPRQDRAIGHDTTSTSGQTQAQLRVIPPLLTAADTSVFVDASAIRGSNVPVGAAVRFRVRLVRVTPSSGVCP